MTSEEKVAFIEKVIADQAKISPSGSFFVELIDVVDLDATGGIPDEAPVLFPYKEQCSVVRKLEEDGIVKNIDFDHKKRGVWLEVDRPKKSGVEQKTLNQIIKRLTVHKEQVRSTTSFTGDFKRLVGIKLYEFIQEHEIIKKEFERRCNYLKNLASSGQINILQGKLFDVIQEMVRLVTIEEVQAIQKEFNNAFGNRLKLKTKLRRPFLTLPQLFFALQNKENYYRFGEHAYYSPSEGEITYGRYVVIPTLKQYELNVDKFISSVLFNVVAENKEREVALSKLVEKYNALWYETYELLYRTPVRLNTSTFEEFLRICTKFDPKPGHEHHYELHNKNSGKQATEEEFEDDKNTVLPVIDDLVEYVDSFLDDDDAGRATVQQQYISYPFSSYSLTPTNDEPTQVGLSTALLAPQKNNKNDSDEGMKDLSHLWITKNRGGKYCFDGNEIYIRNKNAAYAIIFDVAYNLKPRGGKIKYDEIINGCEKRKKKGITKRKIQRALTGNDANLFRYVSGFTQKPQYGIALFVPMQDGKEIEFNNKK